MDSYADQAPASDSADVAAEGPTDVGAEALTVAESRDPVAMGVGAVMALHSVDERTATTALARVATQHQVPVSAVALAVLALVSGADDPFENGAGRAAARLLVQALTTWM